VNDLFNAVRIALGGNPVSAEAMKVLAIDLSVYPRDKVLTALGRCLIELRGNLFLCDVIERIEGASEYHQSPFNTVCELNDFLSSGRRVS
jgi:hypothetical protein